MSDKRLYEELDSPYSYAELKTIISEVNLEKPASSVLFKGKYQVLLLEDLLPWQKPIGHFFKTTLAICGVKPKRISSSVECYNESNNFSDEEEDGCPLPVVFDSLIGSDPEYSSVSVIRQLKEKFYLYPLSQNIGRKLLQLCSCIADEYKFPYPVIVLCHGRNPKQVVIQGNLKNDKFIQVIVKSLGSVSKHEQLPKLSNVKLSHLDGFVPSCTSVETSVYARYDVLLNEKGSALVPSKNMDVVMECYWSNPGAILEPISTDCLCYAKIKSVAGDNDTGASEKFKEVKLIRALCESLETGIIKWPNPSFCGNILQRVEAFMKAETVSLLRKQTAMPVVMDLDLESFDSVVQDNRPDLDFTEKLWLILKDSSSCEELKDALTYVFNELNEFMDFPFVHPKNASTIAKNIRHMKENSVQWPEVSAHLASKMLLEIGIEKLRRDYVTLFVGLELAPYDSIIHFLQPEIPSQEAVVCLEKLHCVLELTIIVLQCLCLPKILISEFIRNVLKYYTAVQDIDLQHIFKFQIPSAKARHLLDQMRPTVWEISLLSSDKDFKKQTVLHYSTTPTSDHIYAPKDYHPKLMLKNASYNCMHGTFVEDSFFVKSNAHF